MMFFIQLQTATSRGFAALALAGSLALAQGSAVAAEPPETPAENAAKTESKSPPRPKAKKVSQLTPPKGNELDKFVDKQEDAAKRAQIKLTKAIDVRINKLKKERIDEDVKALLLKGLAEDKLAFASSRTLPKSQLLFEDVASFVKAYAKIDNALQDRIADEEQAAAKKNSKPAAGVARLKSVHENLAKVFDGDDAFKKGAKFNGPRVLPDRTFTLHLVITERQGGLVLGDLHQATGGGGSSMRVRGKIKDGDLYLENYEMIRGGNTQLSLSGVVVKDRIYALAVETPMGNGKVPPVTSQSWVMLQLEGK